MGESEGHGLQVVQGKAGTWNLHIGYGQQNLVSPISDSYQAKEVNQITSERLQRILE